MKGIPAGAFWPPSELNTLIGALSRAANFTKEEVEIPGLPIHIEGSQLSEWIMTSARFLNVEAEPYRLDGASLLDVLKEAAPAIVQTPDGFLGLLRTNSREVRLLTSSKVCLDLSLNSLRDAIAAPIESPLRPELEEMLSRCGVPAARREQAMKELLRERLAIRNLGSLWRLQTPITATALPWYAGMFVASHAVQYSLFIGSWYLIGRAALAGSLDNRLLAVWGLLMLATIPFRMLSIWTQGKTALGLGSMLKRRLLMGALRLDPTVLRTEGAGQLLGRTLESERVEGLALSGGLGTLLSGVDLLVALWIISNGAAAITCSGLLLVWISCLLLLANRYRKRRREWTSARLKMTYELVEKMTGHRTRLAQQAPEDWHTAEKEDLEKYSKFASRMDGQKMLLTVLVPRTWLIAGLAMLLPIATSSSVPKVAVAIAGILSGYQALRRLSQGVVQLVSAEISWNQLKPIFIAAEKQEAGGSLNAFEPIQSAPVLESSALTFASTVRGVDLRIEEGDAILLEGESGSGKSTLVSLLCGLRPSSSGELLSRGVDQSTLGILAWRKRIACAPQYHENHILSAPLLFNLLMGKTWPPTSEDIAEAQEVCEELGLGPLIEKMPGGLSQMVGETGWQLSQGERSRVFLARALLQGGDLVVLDESFAALDPETMKTALECTLRRAKTLLVVAHP